MVLASFAITGSQAAQAPGILDVSVSGLRSLKGNILVCVTADAKAFPDCSKDANARKAVIPTNNSSHIYFHGMKPGTYAVSLVHDENANGKLDTKAMIPGEGFGFSRNPMILFGPPSFGGAKFTLDANGGAQAIKMKYML